MIDNMYAPPRAELTEPVVVAAPFYVVSRPKFIALFLATLSAYQLFWYYQNWQLQKRSTGEPLWPVPRTIFAVFFVHSLFERVRALGASSRLTADWNASLLATGVVLLMLASGILDHMSGKSIGSPYSDVLSLLILLPHCYALWRAQDQINQVCGDPSGSSNQRFTGWNIVWLALGVALWGLVGVGLHLTLTGQS